MKEIPPSSSSPETTTTTIENFDSLPEKNPEALEATVKAVQDALGATIASQVQEHGDGIGALLEGKLDALPPAAEKTRAVFARQTIGDVLFYMLVCSLRNGLGRDAETARAAVVRFSAGRNLTPVSSDTCKDERTAARRKARQEQEAAELEAREAQRQALLHPEAGSRGERALTLIRAVHAKNGMLVLKPTGKIEPEMRHGAHVYTGIDSDLYREFPPFRAEILAVLEAIGGTTCDAGGRLLIPPAPVATPAEGGAA